jgi:hypothetical protein
MEQNKVENYVVFVNTELIQKLVICGIVLIVFLFLGFFVGELFLPAVALSGYLASNLVTIVIKGMRLPGYQAALARYVNDLPAKKAMIANYMEIKSTKPFALNQNQHLLSLVVGLVFAIATNLAMGPAL